MKDLAIPGHDDERAAGVLKKSCPSVRSPPTCVEAPENAVGPDHELDTVVTVRTLA